MKIIEFEFLFEFIITHNLARYRQELCGGDRFPLVSKVLLLFHNLIKLLLCRPDAKTLQHRLYSVSTSVFTRLHPSFSTHKIRTNWFIGKRIIYNTVGMNTRFVTKGVFTDYCFVWLDNYSHRI